MLLNIELNNEDTMCNLLKDRQLLLLQDHSEFYSELLKQWHEWLSKKYQRVYELENVDGNSSV